MNTDITRIRKYTCERIKYFRRIHNLSQADMAEKLWMSKRSYIRLEKGETAITLDRLIRIARVFNLSYIHLVGIKPELQQDDIISELRNIQKEYLLKEDQIIKLLNELKSSL